jgi:formamidopyrimidine-DNA glycosylase
MTISKIELTELSQKYSKYKGKQSVFEEFNGKTLTKIERKGKFLIWRFNFPKVILNHLGMSGHWIMLEQNKETLNITHPKVEISFEDEKTIAVFEDTRNFGQFKVYNTHQEVMEYSPIRKMGPDGLKIPFPKKEFIKKLQMKRYENKEIGRVLLDQSLIAGVGNIYKSESLALAKISPLRLVKNLDDNEVERLSKSISTTLQKAVKSMGSTIQTYRTSSGEEASGQNWHKVYAKAGMRCDSCGREILRIVQDKRSTFYCENCQK